MTYDELNDEYFEWMYHLVCNDSYSKQAVYRKLLTYLHNVEFTYIVDRDVNRESDGINLRYRFGYERKYEDPIIASYLDDKPCSVLEMMVALALRVEENIMDDPEVGNRIGQWFWGMIVSLGLGGMHDDTFREIYVENAVAKFLNREYRRNGKGGLFTIEKCKYDLRAEEIWLQMCWYLNDALDE